MIPLAAQSALSGVLLATLLVALRHDLLEHRIPNTVCAFALVSGCLIHALISGVDGLLFALQGAGVGFAMLFPLYVVRGMGAGDIKLMCAVGSFLGPLDALLAAVLTLMLGALLGVAVIVIQYTVRARQLKQNESALASVTSVRHQPFPYAVAIAGGALVLMWKQGHLAFLNVIVPG
jgi:prepilin peptidase CpaA